MWSILKYIISISLLLCSLPAFAQEEGDSTDTKVARVFIDSIGQFRIGLDISKPIINAFIKERQAYEFEADYYWKRDMYLAAETGWGSSDVSDSAQQLVYNTSNVFLKAGFNKAMLTRISASDWDIAFIGLRYGVALLQRSAATYTIHDAFYGPVTGSVPADNYMAHWAEITGGVRLELKHGIFTGWNVRARFLLNKKAFTELPPAYIAGYGKGEKGAIFDFNFYLQYALRWNRGTKAAAPLENTVNNAAPAQ